MIQKCVPCDGTGKIEATAVNGTIVAYVCVHCNGTGEIKTMNQ